MLADRLAVEPTNCLCYSPLSLYDEKWISCKRVGKDVNRKPEQLRFTHAHAHVLICRWKLTCWCNNELWEYCWWSRPSRCRSVLVSKSSNPPVQVAHFRVYLFPLLIWIFLYKWKLLFLNWPWTCISYRKTLHLSDGLEHTKKVMKIETQQGLDNIYNGSQ